MYFFKKGLNTRLKVALLGHTCYTLQEMINKVLEMERDRLEADALYKEKKCPSESTSHAPNISEPTCSCALAASPSCRPRSHTYFEPWRWHPHRQLPPPYSEPPCLEP